MDLDNSFFLIELKNKNTILYKDIIIVGNNHDLFQYKDCVYLEKNCFDKLSGKEKTTKKFFKFGNKVRLSYERPYMKMLILTLKPKQINYFNLNPYHNEKF